MTKYLYFVVDDNGMEKCTDKKTFLYYVKEFARQTFNYTGKLTTKSNYSDIWDAYNPQGILIAWKTLK